MACKSCYENLYENISETLIRDNVGIVYDCLGDLVFNFKKAITPFKFKIFD